VTLEQFEAVTIMAAILLSVSMLCIFYGVGVWLMGMIK
jgi:hypothetical protein